MSVLLPAFKLFWKLNAKEDFERIALQTPTANVDEIIDIPYINDGKKEHTLDVYFPSKTDKRLPVIVDIHCGGWIGGSKEINKNYCLNLASKGFTVFSINYRLAGDYRFKDQIEDMFAAFDFIAESACDYSADLNNTFLTGDSAGGHFVCVISAICSDRELQKDFSINEPALKFKAVGAVCPAVDLVSPNIKMNINLPEILGPELKRSKYFKYMDFKRIANRNMPPFYVVTSSGDFLRKQAYKLCETLDRNKIEYKFHDFEGYYAGRKLPHVFPVLDPSPSYSQECINEMLDFFIKHSN